MERCNKWRYEECEGEGGISDIGGRRKGWKENRYSNVIECLVKNRVGSSGGMRDIWNFLFYMDMGVGRWKVVECL